jgi:ubiquinone/menaquinone biosynthesis C-methylase UbiE
MPFDALHEAAAAVSPYGDEEKVRRLTLECVQAGHRVLQIHKLAQDDAEHVAALLDLMGLPEGAEVLDAGCGVGAVAELMQKARTDLRITLLNVSPAQLAMCPDGLPKIAASFHDIPALSASFDAVLFLYSLGHGRPEVALAEAARVLSPGGSVFVYDLWADDPSRMIQALGYIPHTPARVTAAAGAAGLTVERAFSPNTTAAQFIAFVGQDAYDAVFEGVSPVIYRMVKP